MFILAIIGSFVFFGFEHVIANFTYFPMTFFTGGPSHLSDLTIPTPLFHL